MTSPGPANSKIDPQTGKLPPVGNTVNISTATYQNTIGATELKAAWTDPDFDPALEAFCSARMLEIPTPRWTTIQARELGMVPPTSAITMGVESPRAPDRTGAGLEFAHLVFAHR